MLSCTYMYKIRNTSKQAILLKQDKKIFSLNDLTVLWGIENRGTLTTTIRRYKERSILYGLKKGLYSVLPIEKLDVYELGCALCGSFSYVSTETVLVNEGIIMQALNAVTLVGQKNMTFTIGDNYYICRYLNPKFLVNRVGIDDTLRYSVATKERAISDMLFFNPKYYFDNKLAVKNIDVIKLKKVYNYKMKKNNPKQTPNNIIIRSEIRFGKPVVNNTRVAVADILNLLKAGYSIDEIPAQYQGVTKAGTISAIEYAINILGKEETLSISR